MNTLRLVIGGELYNDLDAPAEFIFKPGTVKIIGVFGTYQAARDAWKANAWQTVDNALMRFFIIPLEGFSLHD